jgi:hypothetical protein
MPSPGHLPVGVPDGSDGECSDLEKSGETGGASIVERNDPRCGSEANIKGDIMK